MIPQRIHAAAVSALEWVCAPRQWAFVLIGVSGWNVGCMGVAVAYLWFSPDYIP